VRHAALAKVTKPVSVVLAALSVGAVNCPGRDSVVPALLC
jgi:hypothetical protein